MDWKEYLAKASLFAIIAVAVIGAVTFTAIYGVMRAPDATYTESSLEVLRTGSIAIIGAVVALLKTGD